jgi:hypothetical protein
VKDLKKCQSLKFIELTYLLELESSQANHEIDDVTGRLEMHFSSHKG